LTACLTCACLGDRIGGKDVDEVLAYQTPKVVVIKDRTLGILKFIFMGIIFFYVVIWQVLYKGSHFQMDQLSGVARIQLQQPVRSCNPMDLPCKSDYTSLAKLPYCSQYKGKNASVIQRDCRYFDALDLLTPLDAGYLVPSFIQQYDQKTGCKPTKRNNYKCDNAYEFVDDSGNVQTGSERAKPTGEFFVADIEDFTLLIDHPFRSNSGTVEYDDYKMQGYWLDCSDNDWSKNSTWLTTAKDCQKKPIICKHKECEKMGMVTSESDKSSNAPGQEEGTKEKAPRKRRKRSLQQTVLLGAVATAADKHEDFLEANEFAGTEELSDSDVFSLADGDVMSIRTLYAMAGRSLDDWWYDPYDKVNKSLRKRGTVLVINIHYNNMKPFTIFKPRDPPEYTISVTSRPVDKFKNMKITDADGKKRELTVSYGTLVIVQSTGTIGIFQLIHMLIVFSSSLGLLAAASVITEVLAFNVLPLRSEYAKAKFQETEDFHNLYETRQEGSGASK
jgi:hypothetical protein